MKNFFKYLFASCLGTMLALGAMVLIFGSVASSLASVATKKSVKIKENSVLDLDLDMMIPERTNNVEMQGFSFDTKDVLGLTDIIRAIERAKTDDNIKGIYLHAETLTSGKATISALRRALEDFKDSGKFIVSYGRFYTQNGYHLASLSDKVVLHPSGLVDFRGVSSMVAYYKGLIDKMEVDMRIFYAGKFKSATEPYRTDKMSPENRLQVREYVTALNDVLMADVAKSRKIPETEIRKSADLFDGFTAQRALAGNLIDVIGYEDEAETIIKKMIGLDDDTDLNQIKIDDYFSEKGKNTDFSINDKVAVLYLEGTIKDGDDKTAGSIYDGPVVKDLRKILDDDKVKALVLRINSGGGSVMASDNILREVIRIKKSGRPIVVSMGDVAASGGYYIACEADSIFAEPNTITGSIGVFGMVPILQRTLKNNLGITFDTVKTGAMSTFGAGGMDFSPEEAAMMQSRVDGIYEDFLQKVAKGRRISRDSVHAIAQGRVWPGTKALQIGLVDRLGGLKEAVSTAAGLAKLEKYRMSEYPETKNQLERIISEVTGEDDAIISLQDAMIRKELGEYYPAYLTFKEMREMKGVQMRLPYAFLVN